MTLWPAVALSVRSWLPLIASQCAVSAADAERHRIRCDLTDARYGRRQWSGRAPWSARPKRTCRAIPTHREELIELLDDRVSRDAKAVWCVELDPGTGEFYGGLAAAGPIVGALAGDSVVGLDPATGVSQA